MVALETKTIEVLLTNGSCLAIKADIIEIDQVTGFSKIQTKGTVYFFNPDHIVSVTIY